MSGTTLFMQLQQMTEDYTTLSASKGEFMEKGIFATVEHRKLMELKNCGATDDSRLEDLAQLAFLELKGLIKERRAGKEEKGFFARVFNLRLPVDKEVDLMFTTREELIDHLSAIEVPSELCPITEEERENFFFLDRAARYAKEGQKVLDMFKRHHDVIVDSDRSLVVEWILQNHNRVRAELNKGL